MSKVKIVIFGLGNRYKSFMRWFDESKAEIIAVSDNNNEVLKKKGGEKAVSPKDINNLEFDYIIVTCVFFSEVKEQLKEYGIGEERILDFNRILEKIIVRGSQEEKITNVLKDNIPLQITCELEFEKTQTLEEKSLFLAAKNLINYNKDKKITSLEEVEFKVYSQFGEDGIIQWLIHNVEIAQKTFIEFGSGDYFESNTRFLLMNNNWSGFVMDGSHENIESLMRWGDIWKYDITAKAVFINKDNINRLITEAGYTGDIGILSIDIDGIDFWVLNEIVCVSPRILICEYNNIFGAEKKVCVPYDENFDRTKAHYSGLYWGTSIAAFRHWAEDKNYYYMGSNSAGHNAFFVRKDCIAADKVPQDAEAFVTCKYSESRGEDGKLTFKRGMEALECIKQMKVFNLETDSEDTIENIYCI